MQTDRILIARQGLDFIPNYSIDSEPYFIVKTALENQLPLADTQFKSKANSCIAFLENSKFYGTTIEESLENKKALGEYLIQYPYEKIKDSKEIFSLFLYLFVTCLDCEITHSINLLKNAIKNEKVALGLLKDDQFNRIVTIVTLASHSFCIQTSLNQSKLTEIQQLARAKFLIFPFTSRPNESLCEADRAYSNFRFLLLSDFKKINGLIESEWELV